MLSLVQPSLAVQSSLALCAASQLPANPQFQPAKYISEHCHDFVAFSGKLSIPSHAKTIEQISENAEKLLEKRARPIPRYRWLIPVFCTIFPPGILAAVNYRLYGTPLPESASLIPGLVKALIFGSILGVSSFVLMRLDIRAVLKKAEQEFNHYLETIPEETRTLIAVELAKLRGDDVTPLADEGERLHAAPHEPPPV